MELVAGHVTNFLPQPHTTNAIQIRRDRGVGVGWVGGGGIKGSVPIIIALADVCNRTAALTERTVRESWGDGVGGRGARTRGCGRRGGALGNNCLTRFQPAPGASINRRVAAGTNYMPTFLVTPFAYICQVRWRERTDVRSGTERNERQNAAGPSVSTFLSSIRGAHPRRPRAGRLRNVTCNVQRPPRIRDRIPPDVAPMSLN